jgi:thiosulfate dehydrogenase [quinone] large subunit
MATVSRSTGSEKVSRARPRHTVLPDMAALPESAPPHTPAGRMPMHATAALTGPRSRAYSTFQLTALVALRMLIGWHFLYEGLVKLFSPYWTAANYLAESRGLLSGIFHSWSSSPGVMGVVDIINIWGLIIVGLLLVLGFVTREATIAGILLLALYYLAAPPLLGFTYAMPTEGSYVIVNKVLIELAALTVVALFPTSHIIGLDRMLGRSRGA